MTSQNKTPTFLLLGIVLLLAALLFAACGSGSDADDPTPGNGGAATSVPGSPDATNGTDDPDGTPGPEPTAGSAGDTTPTDDFVAEETRDAIREIERSLRRIDSIVRRLPSQILRSNQLGQDDPEEAVEDWFDECCDDTLRDLDQELQTIRQASLELITIYEEAGDQDSLVVVEQLGIAAANIEAAINVVAALPSSDGATALLQETSLDMEAFAEAVSKLR